MKIILTGCNGQVGKTLTNKLGKTTELVALSRQELDITDQTAVQNIVLNFKPDFIINAAAHTAVDKAENERAKTYNINHDGPLYLAKAAQDVNAVFIHISTDYVFSGNKEGAYFETDAAEPQSVYGASKLAGEQAVIDNCEKHIILRTAWVFGETGNNFVKTMIRLGKSKDELGIVNDQFGSPTYAGDIANAIFNIVKKINKSSNINWGVYHFTGHPFVSWFEFSQAIFEQAEKQGYLKAPKLNAIPTTQFPTPAKRPANSKLNCNKIKREFSILPSNWHSAIQDLKGYV